MPKIVIEFDCSCFGYLYDARYFNLNVGMYEILNFSRNHRFFVDFFTFSPKMEKTWNINLKHPILPLYEVFEQNITSTIKSWIGPKMALAEPSPLNLKNHNQHAICSQSLIRGPPFDSEGGGGGAGTFGRYRLFIFIACSTGKFISGYTEDRIFIRNKFLKKQNKNKKKKGGGGVSARV